MTADLPSITFTTASSDKDFEQILQLQNENLLNNLNKELVKQQGFVFAEHTLPVLKRMAARLPQVIAIYDHKIIGYNLAMSADMQYELPRLTPMFVEFTQIIFKGKNLTGYQFMVGGQVCIDKNFRGQGLMRKLYHETVRRLPPDYELCVTEISTRNPKSLAAHQKIGFELISTYNDGTEIWNIVAWRF